MSSGPPGEVTEEEIASVREHAILAVAIPKRRPPPKAAPKPTPKTIAPAAKQTHSKTTQKPTPPPVQGSPKFEAAFTAWVKTWNDPVIALSSREDAYTKSTEYKNLYSLGSAVLPQIAAKLTVPGNDFAVILYKALDKTWKTKHPKPMPVADMKAAIIKEGAATHKRVAARVAAFDVHKESIISSGLTGVAAAAQLMTNPLFQSIVAEGSAAAVQILQAEAKDKSHHSGIWIEMLRQIHAIEQHGDLSDVQEKQEFEQWLESYLQHSTAAAPPTEGGTAEEGEVDAVAAATVQPKEEESATVEGTPEES